MRPHLPRVQKRAGGGISSLSTPFTCPSPPSHAKASWRWNFLSLDADYMSSTSLTCKSEPEVVFPPSQCCSRVLHLLRLQEQAGGGIPSILTVLHLPFNTAHVSSTSLACKSMPEVVSPPFRRCLCVVHLSHMQKQSGGGMVCVLMPFMCPPPPILLPFAPPAK